MKKNIYFTALIISTVLSLFFIKASYFIDNTTAITGNGLYKARILYNKVTLNTSDSESINHPLYFDTVRFLWGLFKINLWPGNELTKIAYVNSVFAGLAIFSMFMILWRINKNVKTVFLILFFYIFSGYFFFLTISSEDILPAFAVFVFSFWLVVEYLRGGRIIFLFLSGTFYGFSFLLHRTLLMHYPAFFLSILMLNIKSGKALSIKPILLFALFSVIPALILTAHPSVILIPTLDRSGWSGFELSKLAFTFLGGVGQSLLYGKNQSSLRYIFSPEDLVVQIPTLLLLLYLLLRLIKLITDKTKNNYFHKSLSIFLLINFLVPEFINLRTQGQDPQFQIASLIIFPIGLALIYKKSFLTVLLFLSFLIPIVTISKAITIRGYDSKKIAYYKELGQNINVNQSVFLTHGFDSLLSWGTFVLNIPIENQMAFAYYPINYPDLNPEESAKKMLEFLNNAQKQGKQIITTDIITLDDRDLNATLSTVDTSGKGAIIKKAILSSYDIKLFKKISGDSYYYLVSKN